MEIGLYHKEKIKLWKFTFEKGKTVLEDNSFGTYTFQPGDEVMAEKTATGFHLYNDLRDFGTSNTFQLVPEKSSNFQVQPISPLGEKRLLNGLVTFEANSLAPLRFNAAVENYIEGVALAESGGFQGVEYYKVQGIICRTFMYSNWNKHKKEGFNLCDKVHCQVFRGLNSKYPYITQGVQETTDQVLVDSSLNYIETVFHSNSGGQTLNSEDYWQQAVSYLRSVSDEYGQEYPHATWRVKLSEKEWLGYFERQFNMDISDSTVRAQLVNHKLESRSKYFLENSHKISLRTIRKDWKLKSTFFDVSSIGDGKVIIDGKGFGHGVGLSQEGAMDRAKSGITFMDILHHYYKDVYLIDKSIINSYKSIF